MQHRLPLVLLFTCALLSSGTVRAADLPFAGSIRVGRPARDVPIQVTNGPDGIQLTLGTTRHSVDPLPALAVEAESITLGGDASVGVVTVRTSQGSRAILVGKRRGRFSVIWSEYEGLRGDPGERRGYLLVRHDRDNDGVPEVGVAEQHEGVRNCTGELVWVRVQWVNAVTLDLAASEQLTMVGATTPAVVPTSITADTSPRVAFRTPPRHRTLQARWTNAAAAADAMAPLPRGSELMDGDPATGTGTTTDLHAVFGVHAAGAQVHAVALTFGPLATDRTAVPTLSIATDRGPRFHVTLPPDIAAGTRYWVDLPEPQSWHCVELNLGSASPSRAGATLAEFEVFTEVDAPDGLASLVSRVSTDDRHGAEAAALLVTLGHEGMAALSGAWERLGPQGKRRAVIAFAGRVSDSEVARRSLARAAVEPDGDSRDRALAALTKNPKAAFEELALIAAQPGFAGDLAATTLGESMHPSAPTTLLRLISSHDGHRRPAIRAALAVAAESDADPTRSATAAWLATSPSLAARAAALGAIAHPHTQTEAMTVWSSLLQQPLEFEELWRTVGATPRLGPAPEVDAWLTQLATQDERWMVRDAALAALHARTGANVRETAQATLKDDYPRVRATAVGILAQDPEQYRLLEAHFAQEPWPLVRAAVLNEATGTSESNTLPRAALRDPSSLVRIAAVNALIRLEDREAWPEVAKLLANNNEWPAVMSVALQFAESLCIEGAARDLRPVLKRGLKPEAWAPDVDVAMQAIEVLGRLGSPDAHALLKVIEGPDQPPAVREAAIRAGRAQTCGTQPAPAPPPETPAPTPTT